MRRRTREERRQSACAREGERRGNGWDERGADLRDTPHRQRAERDWGARERERARAGTGGHGCERHEATAH